MSRGEVAAIAAALLILACSKGRVGDSPGDGSAGAGGAGGLTQKDAAPGGRGGGSAMGGGGGGPVPWTGRYVDPALPGDVEGLFAGAPTATGKPVVVYPLADSMHPTNIGDITFQWERGAPESSVFRIRLENKTGRFDFFMPCAIDKCNRAMPEAEWLRVARGNADGEVTVTVAGVAKAGGPVALGEPLLIRFTPEDVKGGLYYWSTELQGTYRLVFGDRKAQPFITPKSPTNEWDCGGCHSVSRNGRVIAFTVSVGIGYLQVAPTETPEKPWVKAPPPTTTLERDSSTLALSPDGKRVAVAMSSLTLRDTADGRIVATASEVNLGGGKAFFPEWSPDGGSLAVALAKGPYLGAYYSINEGSIAVIPLTGDAFGTAKVIVPMDKDFHFYPSWSPDGKWIVFASAPIWRDPKPGWDNTSYNQTKARLRLVASTGGPAWDLERATQGVGKASTWPKFSPFIQQSGQVLFIGFNSRMPYGFNHPGPQIWFAAIDLRRLDTGDPSAAPVWLPFQNIAQQNHLPYWTEVVTCSGDSTTATPCPVGRTCRNGLCE